MFLSACGSHQATPTLAPNSSGIIKGIAWPCGGIATSGDYSQSATVQVYRWRHRKEGPIATRVTTENHKYRYSMRLLPGHYWVVVPRSGPKGVSIRLRVRETRVINFQKICP